MSFLSQRPKKARSKVPLGMDALGTASSETGVPVPVWWGTQRVAVSMIVEPFNRYTKPAKGQKKGGRAPANNYAAVVFALGHGPLVSVRQFWVDKELWYDGPLNRTLGADWDPITIPDFGSGRIYWGTETQPIDPTLAATGVDHPAFRGVAYAVFPKALLGTSRDTVPNFEVVATRHGVSAFNTITALDENPMSGPVEVITNARFGLGRDVASLDMTAFTAVADQLALEGLGLSPLLAEGVSVREFLAQIGEYIDGFFPYDSQGRLSARLNRPA